jgi:hypothetical protein
MFAFLTLNWYNLQRKLGLLGSFLACLDVIKVWIFGSGSLSLYPLWALHVRCAWAVLSSIGFLGFFIGFLFSLLCISFLDIGLKYQVKSFWFIFSLSWWFILGLRLLVLFLVYFESKIWWLGCVGQDDDGNLLINSCICLKGSSVFWSSKLWHLLMKWWAFDVKIIFCILV